MMHMTELEERLAAPDTEATQKALCARLQSLATQLRQRIAEQLLTKDEFTQLTLLASASEIAQKVIQESGRTDPPRVKDGAQSE